MSRKNQVLEQAEKFIEQGRKPSATSISQELSWTEEDVHRCLTLLEREGKIETYPLNGMGKRMRMVSVFR